MNQLSAVFQANGHLEGDGPLAYSRKSRVIFLLLWLIAGVVGAHRFYIGRIWSGLAQASLMILFVVLSSMLSRSPGEPSNLPAIPLLAVLVWLLVDAVLIVCGRMRDGKGLWVKEWLMSSAPLVAPKPPVPTETPVPVVATLVRAPEGAPAPEVARGFNLLEQIASKRAEILGACVMVVFLVAVQSAFFGSGRRASAPSTSAGVSPSLPTSPSPSYGPYALGIWQSNANGATAPGRCNQDRFLTRYAEAGSSFSLSGINGPWESVSTAAELRSNFKQEGSNTFWIYAGNNALFPEHRTLLQLSGQGDAVHQIRTEILDMGAIAARFGGNRELAIQRTTQGDGRVIEYRCR